MELHTVHLPCGMNAKKKRNPLWAGNHLAHVPHPHIKIYFVVNVLAAIIHSCPNIAQGHWSARTLNLTHNCWQNPQISIISSEKNSPYFFFPPRNNFPPLHTNSIDMRHKISKTTTFLPNVTRLWLTSYRQNISSDVYTSRYTDNYFLSICQSIFPIHFRSMIVVIDARKLMTASASRYLFLCAVANKHSQHNTTTRDNPRNYF